MPLIGLRYQRVTALAPNPHEIRANWGNTVCGNRCSAAFLRD